MLKKANKLLKENFGYDSFRKGQELIIDSILNKKDTLGIMPTGGGKSLCYQIPALLFDNLTIVISPLISLMKDQIDFLVSKKYPAAMLNSTVSPQEQDLTKKMTEEKRIKLLYLTPERFRNKAFFEWISAFKISCFVIDEAHCISEWGHDFRPEYRRLADIIKNLGKPPVLALTATATPEVRDDIVKSLKMNEPNIFVSGFNRENLVYGVQNHITKEEKNRAMLNFVQKVSSPGIIYTSSVKDAEAVFNILKTNIKKNVGIYHGSLPNNARKKMQEDFLENRLDVLIATNAFGMGVNKKDIRFVLHYSIPGSIEAYYQETGRAGRDGQTSYCLLLALDDDERIQDFFIQSKNPSLKALLDVFKEIKKESTGKILYVEYLLETLEIKKYNKFIANSIIKQLQFMECIDFEYIKREEIEINIKKDKFEEEDREFIEEIFSASIKNKIFLTGTTEHLAKRAGITEKMLKERLNELREKKIILLKIIKKGQIIKIKADEIPKQAKTEYQERLNKKIEVDRKKLSAMVKYANLKTCRKEFLLKYFGENIEINNCTKCDICRGTYKNTNKIEWNKIQKEIMLFFFQHDGKIGKSNALKILKGAYDIDYKYREWDEYGTLKNQDFSDIQSELHLLIKSGMLELEKGKYPVIATTNKGMKEFRAVYSSKN